MASGAVEATPSRGATFFSHRPRSASIGNRLSDLDPEDPDDTEDPMDHHHAHYQHHYR